MLKRIGLFFILFALAPSVMAAGRGLVLDGALGFPSVTISNPDNSTAGYEGLSLQGRVLVPVVDESKFGMFFFGVIRYHDLENTYGGDNSTEVANHIGPGAGLMFRYGGMHLAFDYDMMKARHYYIGGIGRKTEFDYTATNIDIGASVNFGTMRFGVSYSMGAAAIEKSETGASRDADYKEQTIWLTLTYASDLKLSDVTKNVLK